MTKPIWLFVVSPAILAAAGLLAGVVPLGFGGVYLALAILQIMFLLAALERLRRAARILRGERVTMPMWQQIILAILGAYALLLVFMGALTKQ